MHTITHAEAPASESMWAAFAGLRAVDEALAALDELCADIALLREEVAWRNSGVSIEGLQQRLERVIRAVAMEVVLLRSQQAVVQAAVMW